MARLSQRFVHTFLLALVMCSCTGSANDGSVELALADEALVRMDFAAALAHLDEAIRLHPNNAQALFRRGQVRWQTSSFEGAIADLTRALELDPDLTWAYFFRAASLVSLRRFEEAIPDLDRVIASRDVDDADVVRAHSWRAIAQINIGQLEAAIQDYTRCIELQPLQYVHRVDRGWTYETNGQRQNAIDDYRAALKMKGVDEETVLKIRAGLARLGDASPGAPQAGTPTDASES